MATICDPILLSEMKELVNIVTDTLVDDNSGGHTEVESTLFSNVPAFVQDISASRMAIKMRDQVRITHILYMPVEVDAGALEIKTTYRIVGAALDADGNASRIAGKVFRMLQQPSHGANDARYYVDSDYSGVHLEIWCCEDRVA